MDSNVYTVGHSTHTITKFLDLLACHSISAIADVRSSPYSKFNPQFNRKELQKTLASAGIRYVFLGRELGARSDDPSCYVHDKVQYDRLAKTDLFQKGIKRVAEGARSYRVALMCAEKDPLHCHRTILIARELIKLGTQVQHILPDGSLESHVESIRRLRIELGIPAHDLFRSDEELVDESYSKQADRIAYDRSATRAKTFDENDESILSGATR